MKMKKSYSHNVNIYVVIFIVLSLFISALATGSSDSPELKTKIVFGQIESALVSLKNEDKFVKSNIRDVLELHLMPEVNTQFFSNKVLGKNLTKIPNELKGDFVKNLTKKKNFLQESDVDSNEAAQIFEGYQSLVNGNKDLAKQIDSGQLYIPKSAESFEQVKGGFVPNDTDGMRTNKIYFDFNNLMGQGQTWFLFDGTKLIPKARVD